MSKWITRRSDEAATAPAPATPAPATDLKPLDQADKNRPEPSQQPTAAPEPPEPVPMNELLKAFEKAAKSLYDASLNIEKAGVELHKISSSGGRTPAEQSVISKAESIISQVEQAKESVSRIAESVKEFRGGLSEKASSGWTSGK